MWAEGQATISIAKIKTKNLVRFDKYFLSSNPNCFPHSVLMPVQSTFLNFQFTLSNNLI